MVEETTVVIMASGFSNRMGTNKLFLKLGSETFIEHALKIAVAAGFHQVVLVIKPEDLAALTVPAAVTVVENTESHLGQSRSVVLGTQVATGRGIL